MYEIIEKLLMEQLDLEAGDIAMDKSFIDDFEMDSLDMVEMLVDLEKETDIKIENEEIEKVKTVADLVELLEGK